MRVLLSDGSGLTARQVATQLSREGHHVEVLTPDPLALTRFTRHVRRVHHVTPFGSDPFGWLKDALAVYRSGRFDVLFPTQEQVAVLSQSVSTLRAMGIATAVPDFDALAKVQDKVSARATLLELSLPQPDATVVTTASDLAVWDDFPVFVKTPIGTATTGVRLVRDAAEAKTAASALDGEDGFSEGGVLVQSPVTGPLVMVQAVFARGKLYAFHANRRVREGASGGASNKESIDLPGVRADFELLGSSLGWHGALSADVILTDDGPRYIDINPRLVEPGNAWRAGVDLVGCLLAVACDKVITPQPAGRAGVATHQLVLAVLGTAQHVGTRRAVFTELLSALRHTGSYRDSVEETTPLRHDVRTAVPVLAASVVTLAYPPAWRFFSSGAVTNYALTPAAWRDIRRGGPAG